MNPGPEDRIVDQHAVHHPLDQAGMAEAFAGEDRIGLPDVGEIFAWPPRRPRRAAWCRAICQFHRKPRSPACARQPRPPRDSRRARTRAPRPAARRCRWRRDRRGFPPRSPARRYSPRRDLGDLAVIDRLDEARLDQPVLQKGAAPSRHRHVHHVGHDVDARHQPAARSRSAAPPCRRGSCFRIVWRCCRPRRGRFRAGRHGVSLFWLFFWR